MEPVMINPKQSKLRVAPEWADVCFTCGTCASGCPVTGVDGLDPRKAVRMAALGLDQELIDSRFPWVCTLCGRCEYACPQGVEILKQTEGLDEGETAETMIELLYFLDGGLGYRFLPTNFGAALGIRVENASDTKTIIGPVANFFYTFR